MVITIAKKEIAEVIRDGRLRLLGVLMLLLMLTALAFSVEQTLRAQHARSHAQERAAAQWEGQGDKNPHVAAHYGTHLFAPLSLTSVVDPGVSAFLGRSVKMEAHKRNISSFSAAQDGANAREQFSVAMVLLLLMPLLVIAIGYGFWALERERGTLRQLLSTGVSRTQLLLGKSLALTLLVVGLLAPGLVVLSIVLWLMGGSAEGDLGRLLVLFAGYVGYFLIFAGLTLFASARATTSRGALVAMVGAWGLCCLVAPRAIGEYAEYRARLPSKAELSRQVSAALEHGVDGDSPREETIDQMVKDKMKAQGLEDTGLLVDDSFLMGFELQAEAAWEDGVYDHFITRLDNTKLTQERIVSDLSFLSPFVAMRELSSAICGTDLFHHQHFTRAAERWRKAFVTSLNEDFASNAGAAGWDYTAGETLWRNAPPFEYSPPTLAESLSGQLGNILSLLAWGLVAWLLGWRGAARTKVVV